MNALRDFSSATLLANHPDEGDEYSAFAATHAAPAAITFEEIVERYHGKVFQLVYRYTGDYEEASDLTQDTFVRAYRAWGEFRGESQIYTWLYRIALNLCHNQRKKGDRKKRLEGASLDAPQYEDDESRPLEVADARPQPSHRIENDELRERLHEALLSLPDNYRTVIVLRDIEGLSYEEIASVTDSTLEAIKSRLFRARTLLREILSPYLFGAGQAESPGKPQRKNAARRLGWKFGKGE
jgi:RNA polymerase sigma-70 factor (ECF subfamily)